MMNRPLYFDRKFRDTAKETMPKEDYITSINNYCDSLEKYCDELEEKLIKRAEIEIQMKIYYEKFKNRYLKSLWALSELMGDKGIYIRLGFKDLYFATFEELRKWIEDR